MKRVRFVIKKLQSGLQILSHCHLHSIKCNMQARISDVYNLLGDAHTHAEAVFDLYNKNMHAQSGCSNMVQIVFACC